MNNDLISRAELLKEIEPDKGAARGVYFFDCSPQGKSFAVNLEAVKRMIVRAPAVDAEPVRHGYWIPQDSSRTKFMCSDCKSRNHDGSGKFCSRCGCKMDAEVEG